MRILVDGQTLSTEEAYRGIGVYFKNVLNAAVKQDCLHEWYLLVPSKDAVRLLDAWVQERVEVIVDERANPALGIGGNSGYTECIASCVEERQIDCCWLPNPLMMNVLFPERLPECSFFATVHDLIPLLFPPEEWQAEVRAEYKRRVDFLAAPAVRLLCVSEATRQDVATHLGKTENVFVTLEAADSRLFYRRREAIDLQEEPYIVFTGGFDYRKNIEGAVEAFSLCLQQYADDEVVRRLKLYIVCKCDAIRQEAFAALLAKKGLTGRVILTGYVSDERLVELYQRAAVFFFPSFYEGFGLPILEAMLSGTYVVSADNSSLPEVCGSYALLCDAKNTKNMAEQLYKGLVQSLAETVEEKRERQQYALAFSWERTAAATVAAFAIPSAPMADVQRELLAIVTPWPYQRTGIANYIDKLLPYLSQYFSIDIYIDNFAEANFKQKSTAYATLYPLAKLDETHAKYRHILYQFGNNSKYHTGTYLMFCKYPGIAEIHDYILAPFFYHSFMLKNKKDIYKQALLLGYGDVGAAYFAKLQAGTAPQDEQQFPMCHAIVKSAPQVIFHNYWSKQQMPDDASKIAVIPHACFDLPEFAADAREQLQADFAQRFQRQADEILIGCLGFVNFNKRPETLITAVASLVGAGYKVKLIFWGENNWNDLQEYVKKHQLENYLFITGYLDEKAYDAGLAMSDIIVNLRYPSMGESSGTLCEAFKYGRPVIVSNVNQYKEFPDEVCWKINVNRNEPQVLAAMLRYLIDHPQVRQALGENAKAYADMVLSPARMARRYFEVISENKC